MTSQALARDALMPSAPRGTGRGIGLSLLVHVGLIVAIAFGVSWRSRTPEAQQAELWAAVPLAAAPRAVEPEVVIEPRPAPPPVVKPAPRIETPPPAPIPDAQIAVEKARVEKARMEKARKEQEAAEREAQRKKADAERLAAEKLRQQQLEKQKELAKQKELEAQRKQQALEERQAQQREADRRKNLDRMLGQAGASGEPGATGAALQSAGPSASYTGRIVARVRPNIVFADPVAGNPTAEVEVRAAADGTILGRKLVKSSGIAAWDNAVLRAIDKTEVLPRDVDGHVPTPLVLVFRRND